MLRQVTLDELLKDFSPEGREKVLRSARHTNADALVLFENVQMDSSQFGSQSVLCVGPTCTYKSVQETDGRWLNDLPSQRQYPRAWTPAPKETDSE
jgi:hypothetical protein